MLCDVQQRLDRMFPEPLLFAHRGARAHAPENTLEAFELAIRLGATGLETDVWMTRDGIVVVDHDGFRRNLVGRRWIRDYAYEDLPFRLSRLEDILTALPCGSFSLSIDVKDPAAFDPVVRIVKDRRIGELTYLCHPDMATLEREMVPDVRFVHSTRIADLPNGPEQHAAHLARLGIAACNLHFSDWSGGLTTLYHRFGIAAFGWDVQHLSQASSLLRMGIDALYGDDVPLLHEAMSFAND